MSTNEHWLGDPELWGLTPRRFGEIRDELEDHVHCVSAREGETAAAEQRAALAGAKARRRLSAVHLADQVYATLNRLPTRREWHEFAWLGVWFALIVLSDWLSLQAQDLRVGFAAVLVQQEPINTHASFPNAAVYLTTVGWALQGLARAGFFASFAFSLGRAVQIGWGVALARVMQLKLIHTVLVVAATMLLGERVWGGGPWVEFFTMPTPWPHWLIAPVICGVAAVAGAVLCLGFGRRYWQHGLALVLCVLFLYPGGPYLNQSITMQLPLSLVAVREGSSRSWRAVASGDPQQIEDRARAIRQSLYANLAVVDEQNDQLTCMGEEPLRLPFHIAAGSVNGIYGWSNWYPPPPWYWSSLAWDNGRFRGSDISRVTRVLERSTEVRSPISLPGAGVGWLAVPIPLLGIIGFLGLILVLGRRGLADMVLYSVLCLFAMVLTLLPYVEIGLRDVAQFGLIALVDVPCPNFHSAFLGDNMHVTKWLLVGGFIFSAGIPWLLTGMFLRPGSSRDPGPDEVIAD